MKSTYSQQVLKTKTLNKSAADCCFECLLQYTPILIIIHIAGRITLMALLPLAFESRRKALKNNTSWHSAWGRATKNDLPTDNDLNYMTDFSEN